MCPLASYLKSLCLSSLIRKMGIKFYSQGPYERKAKLGNMYIHLMHLAYYNNDNCHLLSTYYQPGTADKQISPWFYVLAL